MQVCVRKTLYCMFFETLRKKVHLKLFKSNCNRGFDEKVNNIEYFDNKFRLESVVIF